MLSSDFTRRPIDEEKPYGTNPNGLDEFTEIKRQINNINKVTGRVSWKKVQTLSKEILSKNSKDFRCSCYFTVAATHNEGLKGLVEGLNSILDLCVIYWFTAYPEVTKSNARIGAIDWMVEHTDKRIKSIKTSSDDILLIETCHRLCLRIEEELRLHYGIKAPSLGGIRRTLKQWVDEHKESEAKLFEAENTKKLRVSEEHKKAIPVAQPSTIKINVSNNKPKNAVEVAGKATSNYLVIYLLVGSLILALSSHFIYKQYQRKELARQIVTSDIPQLNEIVHSLKYEYASISDDVRPSVVNQLDELMKDWGSDPIKVYEIDTLNQLTIDLTKLYPDSSSVLRLRNEFTNEQQKLNADYIKLHRRFSNARTVFANAIRGSESQKTAQAYEYSNSLFPLIGRIEYAEKEKQQKELQKSLQILNVYLHKIKNLESELKAIKP
ncbi:type VI secretion system ImpA family N-terminal domain-containing protein [Vibrio sp. SNU_ST1]|uniref:type VI secretion system ImpA family N-terminal domain-containing protein n=1 Tax=Vibrio sp. SNU_ST1 TaxID=3064001 RepID=UPI00272D5326|nr:type VI secretion system ImpA family N-terminal domain-containing protein [Vibrio sp. SNU_ST1]WKY59628.1 type VI secretion system ImpA family N-terminal domain-containing protein [Vibrio sp. SNU_ST1]